MAADDEATVGMSLGERAAVGRIAETLFGHAAEPVRFGRYRVVQRIGAGAFGRVYRVHDPELDRDVALKLLHPSAARADAESIVEEARSMAAITHPNVVSVFDVGVVDDARVPQAYIAMQLVQGTDLRRWLQRQPPRRQVIDVLVQAGRGVAAAHHAGLVHGDFKPDNVLVEDGRAGPIARVVDFGLARTSAEVTDEADELATLTTSPRLRGTPAYMAPEQLDGRTGDAHSDQFAFFVTVYEALHGHRPFSGATPIAIAAAILAGERRAIDASLPRSMRHAIARGLAPDPADRFATMDAALGALRRRGRSPMLVTASVLALATGAAAWIATTDRPLAIEGCAGAPPLAWDDEARARGTKAYAASELPFAAQAWERAEPRLDAWSDRWTAAHVDACTGTGGPETELRRLRVECLHEQRIAFATAVEQVVAATPETVRAMAELTEALPDVVQCESPGAQPQAAIDRAPVVALLQQAQGRYLMGDAAGTRTVAAEAQARAEAIADARLAAQARGWAALASLRSGDPEPAREQTRAAFDAAVAAGDPSFAAFLALSLATAHGYDARDPEAGRTWIREAETQLERAGRPPRLVARLHSVQAARHQVLGDFTAAREAAALAVQTLEAWDPTSVGLVEARANMGALAQLAGDTRSAAQWLDAARAQAEVQLGPRHPIVGTIASNQMPPLIALGRYREAERRGAEALAILGGADADVVLNLGIALQLQGRAEDARQRYADALRLVEDRHGGNDPRVGQVLVNLADLDARTGRLDEAMAEIERARAVFDAAVPAGHPAHAIVYATESLVHRQRGELARAIERGAAAHAIASAAGDAALRAAVELEYGEALRVADDDRAAAVLDGSVTRAADGDPRLLARLEFALALALGRNHPRAETLVRAALDRYPAEGDPIERQAMQAWVD